MNTDPYPHKTIEANNYLFISAGVANITKGVRFKPMGDYNLYNLAFRDILPDDSIDDNANSNNGDMIKVLATVISIVKDFTKSRPAVLIHFKGSNTIRTRLYARILRRYYSTISEEFQILGIINQDNDFQTYPFLSSIGAHFDAFLIKRIA